jgi:hypothetical protein
MSERVTVKTEKSKLVNKDDTLVRVATRLPAEVKVEMKVLAAMMDIPLNAMYGMVLREFIELGVYRRKDFEWTMPRTSPRKDRHGEPRGDMDWVQVLMIIPSKLAARVEKESEEFSVSLAAFAYSAMHWYLRAQKTRQRLMPALRRRAA